MFIIFSLFVSTFMFASNGNIPAGQGIANVWHAEAIEVLILIATSILAGFLFVISFIAYRKDRRKRLLFITAAFFLFAVKGFLMVLNGFLEFRYLEGSLIEPIAQLLDFGILALFFLGLIKTRV
jgi:heme/copper-type cytochrome/quinol oxidase subunit 3